MDILNIIQGSPKPADSDLMTSGRKSSDDDKLNSMRGSETKSSATKSSSKKPCKKCAKWKAIIDEGEALNAENN